MQARTRDLVRIFAILGAAGILAMAGLGFAAGRDGWMRDLRQWTPRSSLPGLSGRRLDAYFERLQVVPTERRPFRITLQLPAAARPGDHLATEHRVTLAGAGAICLSLLSFASHPAPDVPVTTSPVIARVWVGDELAHSRRADADAAGVAIAWRGAEGSGNSFVVRLEVATEAAAEGASSRPPVALHFEYLRLRRCGA